MSPEPPARPRPRPPAEMPIVRVICSYCQRVIDEVAPHDVDYDTHDICGECLYHFQQQGGGVSLGEFLDGFGILVQIQDTQGRTLAASQVMADHLGRSDRAAEGLLGQSVKECAHARHPSGCGRDRHVLACAVRRALVGLTMGEAEVSVPATSGDGADQQLLTVHAVKQGLIVTITLDPEAAEEHAAA